MRQSAIGEQDREDGGKSRIRPGLVSESTKPPVTNLSGLSFGEMASLTEFIRLKLRKIWSELRIACAARTVRLQRPAAQACVRKPDQPYQTGAICLEMVRRRLAGAEPGRRITTFRRRRCPALRSLAARTNRPERRGKTQIASLGSNRRTRSKNLNISPSSPILYCDVRSRPERCQLR